MNMKERLAAVQKDIREAQERAEHHRDIRLIAVSKTVDENQMMQAIELGVRDFGENKAQEIQKKYPLLPKDITWHLIGTLQTNKVKYIIDKVDYIHSLDRRDLALEIEKQAAKISSVMKCLVQINISKEDTKHGLSEENVIQFIQTTALECSHIEICGLMGMAPFEINPEETRPYFKKLKELADRIEKECIPRVHMTWLSMGMSNDYVVAIEEGSNMIRIGTAIFGERNYSN